MNDELDQLLANLRLRRLRELMPSALSSAVTTRLSYEGFLLPLLREEWRFQQERALQYRIDQAEMPEDWTLESFPFALQPGVNAAAVRQLAALDWVTEGQNIVLIGCRRASRTADIRLRRAAGADSTAAFGGECMESDGCRGARADGVERERDLSGVWGVLEVLEVGADVLDDVGEGFELGGEEVDVELFHAATAAASRSPASLRRQDGPSMLMMSA